MLWGLHILHDEIIVVIFLLFGCSVGVDIGGCWGCYIVDGELLLFIVSKIRSNAVRKMEELE